jgi:hypothetical protein
MKEYLITLFVVCAVSAIVRTVGPDGALKKYIELICAVCIIAVLVLPLGGVLSEVFELDTEFDTQKQETTNYDEIYKSYLLQMGTASAEERMSSELCRELGVDENSIRIRLHISDDGEKRISRADAIIGAGAIDVDPRSVSEAIKNKLGVECEIIYDIFGD